MPRRAGERRGVRPSRAQQCADGLVVAPLAHGARQVAAHGLDTPPLSSYRLEPGERGGLLLGYAALAERDIREGMRRLSLALASERSSSRANS